jgi:hypothetical protein
MNPCTVIAVLRSFLRGLIRDISADLAGGFCNSLGWIQAVHGRMNACKALTGHLWQEGWDGVYDGSSRNHDRCWQKAIAIP